MTNNKAKMTTHNKLMPNIGLSNTFFISILFRIKLGHREKTFLELTSIFRKIYFKGVMVSAYPIGAPIFALNYN